MNRDELLALAERVEALTGADREVDAEIFLLQWPGYRIQTDCEPFPNEVQPGRIQEVGGFAHRTAPAFTASLDAAMSLVPTDSWHEIKGPRKYLNIPTPSPNYWSAHLARWNHEFQVAGWGATPALALTGAALRAIAAQQPSGAMTGE
jgi:hypothetical protein